MAKIRQEINIGCLNGSNFTTESAAISGGGGYIQLDTTRYSGSVTYYLEIVAGGTTGSQTFALRRKGTSTNDTTISVNNGSAAYARLRSSSFSPPAGQTEYFLFSSTSLYSIKAARLIILQDTSTDPLTAIETQIEIGAAQTGNVNTVAAALTNPKYWYYDSAVWDGTCTFYAECTNFQTGSGVITIKLQEDNGSFASWTDKVTIVNAATPSSITRTRSSSFTPTSGRNYRIVGSVASNMDTWEIYNAKIIVQQVGTVAGGTDIVMDSYSESNASTFTSAYAGISGTARGQSFTSTGGFLDSAKFSIRKNGSPTGNINAYVYAHSGTYGSSSVATGAALATSDSIDISTLTSSFVLTTFTFSGANRVFLSPGTKYVVAVAYNGGSVSNSLEIEEDTSSPTHAGNHCYSSAGSVVPSAGSLAGNDICFYVYTNTTSITKLEPQYLLANAASSTTGLNDFNTYYDPAEWSGVTNVYFHEQHGSSNVTNSKLQQDPDGTPADISFSSITATTLGLTFSSSAHRARHTVYYFDASDNSTPGTPDDPNNVWTDETNLANSNTADASSASANGSTSSNYAHLKGTTAPTSGNGIGAVRANFRASTTGTSTYEAKVYTSGLGELLGTIAASASPTGVTLSAPTGGWTWQKLSDLEVKIYRVAAGDGLTTPSIIEISVEAGLSMPGSAQTLDTNLVAS